MINDENINGDGDNNIDDDNKVCIAKFSFL